MFPVEVERVERFGTHCAVNRFKQICIQCTVLHVAVSIGLVFFSGPAKNSKNARMLSGDKESLTSCSFSPGGLSVRCSHHHCQHQQLGLRRHWLTSRESVRT